MPRKKRRESLGILTNFMDQDTNKKKRVFAEQVNVDDLLKALKSAIEDEGNGDLEENMYNGTLLSRIFDIIPFKKSKSTPFSSLTNEDEKILAVKGKGMNIDASQFNTVVLSEHFQHFEKRILQRWNLKAEIGRRTIIDLYLLEACGDLQDNNDSLTIFPEHLVKETQITNDLSVNGNIDYVIASGSEESRKHHQQKLLLGTSEPKTPYFCIVEAKKDETFGAGSGQTLAEMKAMWTLSDPKKEINGALTDGRRWIFFRLLADGQTYFQSDVINHPQESKIIAGILPTFIRGDLPLGCTLEP